MKKPSIEHYSKIAPQYYRAEIPVLLEKLVKKEQYRTLLDCGCGDGSLLNSLKKEGYFEKREIHAIDLSKKRVALVSAIDHRIRARVDDVEELSTIEQGSIDLLFSTQVIEHVDQVKMLRSIARVMKKNGTVYISTVFKKWYGWYFYRNGHKWVIDPTHIREYQHDYELFDYIEEDTFEVIQSRKSQLWFPLIDFIVKRLHVQDRRIFENRLLTIIRKIKIPIIGYYNWEIILKRR